MKILLKFANIHISFALFLIILLLLSPCESSREISNDGSKQQQQRQHQYSHRNIYQQKEDLPPPSSSTQKGPRLIGLNVNGRVKSLLWNNPRTFIDSQLSPIFSSPYQCGDEEHEGHHKDGDGLVDQIRTAANSTRNEPKQRRILSLLLPAAVYATADYHFRKERWYGVEKVGIISRWNILRPWSHCTTKDDGDEKKLKISNKSKFFASPNTLDIAAYRSVSSLSLASHTEGVTSLIDSGNLRIGWQQNDDNDVVGVGGANPWIQIGFEPKDSISNDDFLVMNGIEGIKNPLYLRCFLPLIRRRFDLQWTSRWDNLSAHFPSQRNARRESDIRNQWSSKHRRPNDDPWWIPEVSLDPSMGTLSSENRYRNKFSARDDRHYFTEFKLRLRTTMPTLLSSVTNNAMPTSDDGNDLENASLRLECSLLTHPREELRHSKGSALTTARFETIVFPSFWLRSVTETARFGLIHERNHCSAS